jgi:DNA ligase-1
VKKSLQLAKSVDRDSLSSGQWSGYVMEPKYDGMRVAIVKKDDKIVVYGRSWDEYTDHIPHIVEVLSKVERDFHLDGELVFAKSVSSQWNGQPIDGVWDADFNQTMRIMGSLSDKAIAKQKEVGYVKFIAFDLLEVDGMDISHATDAVRREMLLSFFETISSDNVHYIERWSHWDVSMYDALLEMGIEGAMLKNASASYIGKRPNKTWYKIKKVNTFDVVVMGFYEGTGKHKGRLGGLTFGAYHDGKLVRIGKTGGGFDDNEREHLWTIRESVAGMVMEIQANDLVGSKEIRTPRHPQFIRFRDDKKAEECSTEQFRVES